MFGSIYDEIFTTIEPLEDGFYYNNKSHIGEMVIWNNQKIRIRGEPLKAKRISSIAYGDTKDTAQITVVYHLMKQETTNRKTRNTVKTRQQLENETGKNL